MGDLVGQPYNPQELVVFAAAVIPATPIVILAPLIIATPVLVFTPFLARSNGPVNIGHVKTGFARNDGCLKAFPEPGSDNSSGYLVRFALLITNGVSLNIDSSSRQSCYPKRFGLGSRYLPISNWL